MEKQMVSGIECHVSDEIVNERKRGIVLRTGACGECGKKMGQLGTGRTMRYCSDACRMRAYRQRKGKSASVKNVTRDETARILEMESAIEVLEAENQVLHDELSIKNVTIETLRKDLAAKNVTGYENEVLELHLQSGGQCQASTKRGERCRSRQSLRIVTSELKGGVVAMSVCPTHHRKFEKFGRIKPHSSLT